MLPGTPAGSSAMQKTIAFLSLAVGLVAVLYFSYKAAEKKAENDAWLDALQTVKDAETALAFHKPMYSLHISCQHRIVSSE
jgi:hypothetical protein